ncbi:SDR family oxidoreductase [Pendulispora rubella]|uniref:SDR family oxidoreductase n=1 Tax=Pendulispora rubella TaxID=2741070 RepID=A0ABZ2L5T1_9BACT
MTRRALCVGGSPELHAHLEPAYAAVDVTLRAILDPAAALDEIRASDHGIDILVWAVAEPSDARFGTIPRAEYRAYFDRTVHSALRTIQGVLVGMERRRFGRILALTNLNARLGDEDVLASMASGATQILIKSVAREGARRGITANALVLGMVSDWEAATSKIVHPFYEFLFPFREPFGVADVARAVAELTTSASGKINGQVIHFDGGTL